MSKRDADAYRAACAAEDAALKAYHGIDARYRKAGDAAKGRIAPARQAAWDAYTTARAAAASLYIRLAPDEEIAL